MLRRLFFIAAAIAIAPLVSAQETPAPTPKWQGKFEQLDQLLPTPNEYRSGSGAPGPKYWQQKADYVISVELNDDNQSITGSETITYTNNAPEALKYLWMQLDQNIIAKDNNLTLKSQPTAVQDSTPLKFVAEELGLYDFDGGFKIKSIKDANGNNLEHTINYTMMRVDLPQPLAPGQKFVFNVEWSYNIGDRMKDGQRSGLEFFPEDGNYSYTIAQFFPRMCVFDDYVGWQHKQFLGGGEFALPFGDYKVKITVPADHIVAATGTLKNPQQVLSATEQARLAKAKVTFDKPVFIVTQEEAIAKEKSKSTQKKTWEFEATNVRDFAFASSRKYIWDAMAVKVGNKTPLAQSYYPKEGNPLWAQESTVAVKNTLVTYSKYSIDYPYPQATSVHAASIGMEYPMICFNFGRPNKDGTYSDRTKYGMIGVIIHEVGHSFFPMIINNDERQWAWMDEGINSFIQYRTEQECYKDFPSRRGPVKNMIPYLKGNKDYQRPIMTNPEQILQLGNEQYGKPATALNILRETVMGPELFDRAFKEYCQRWAFKHPKPADFFRTMEDASAVDLDWFWRGWFYTTDHTDQSIDQVKWFKLRKPETNVENKGVTAQKGDLAASSGKKSYDNFDNGPESISLIETDPRMYGEFQNRIDDKAIMSKLQDKNIYEVTLSNKGGLVMPVIIEWTFKDGSKEIEKIPAEIWRNNEQKVTKVFVKDKEVVNIVLDPNTEVADINAADNVFPKNAQASKFDEFKKKN